MEEMSLKNKFVATRSHINGAPAESDFEIKTQGVKACPMTGEVLVKMLYVSVDPYQLNRMKAHSSSQATGGFATAIAPGQPVDAFGIGRVVASGRADLAKDDLVAGLLTWGEYSLVKPGTLLNKLDPLGLPLSYHVGTLGFSGLTAYAGLFEIGKPMKGESVFVSTAAGSVGSLVGQYAKLAGCHVVGCAGSQHKVDVLKKELGFDDAFNYKDETDLKSALKRYFPNGIDIYFDNVGGEMLEAAVANMNLFGRVALCGAISEYTGGGRKANLDTLDAVYKRIKIQGFLAGDFLKCYPDFMSTTVEYIRAGKMKALCDVSHGVESIPHAFVSLFRGDNIGKVIVKIADK